jgi:soluble cytochrome b562
METTIKVSKETKDRILSLGIADKTKTFDMIINELVSNHQHYEKKYRNDVRAWEKSMRDYEKSNDKWKKDMVKHERETKEYEKGKDVWVKLLKWAKSQGFKG